MATADIDEMARGLWVQISADLMRHPKLKKMARHLNEAMTTSAGRLFLLWAFALEFYPDGNLPLSGAEIADAMNFEDDAEKLMDALLNCGAGGRHGFLEETPDGYRIHDWEEFSGAYDKRREQMRDASAKYRQKKKNIMMMSSQNHDDVMMMSSENHPIEEEEEEKEKEYISSSRSNKFDSHALESEFEALWKQYPRKTGKEQARKSYLKHRKSGIPHDEIQKGLSAYVAYISAHGTEERFILMGSTFFGPNMRWRDHLEQSRIVTGGFMAPTSAEGHQSEAEVVNTIFKGDWSSYARWCADGKPADTADWLKRNACSSGR